MTKRHLFQRAASAALLTLAASAGASADIYTPSSDSMTDPTIHWAANEQAAALGTLNAITVVSDGFDYQSALDTHLAIPFHIHSQVTNSKWRIKESFIVIGVAPLMSAGQVGTCCGSLAEFSQFNFAVPINHSAAKEVEKDAWWTVEVKDNSLGTRARNACRNLRLELQQQGLSREEIFSQDRSATLPTDFRYVARVGHRNHNHDLWEIGEASIQWKQSAPTWKDINVICQRDMTAHVGADPNPDPTPNPIGSTDLAVPFQVTQAALAITPKKYEGKCPAKLHLDPTIETIGKGTVKYRFVDQLGNHSQTFQVKFDKSDVKFLDHVVEIDGKGKPKGLGFAAAQPQGGQLGLAAPNDPNLTQGYFQVEIVSPHKKLSNIADYSVKCTVKTAGNGELAAKPDVVNPVAVGDLTIGLADLYIDSIQPSPAVPTKLFIKVSNKGKAPSTPTNLKAIRWVGNQSTARGTLVPAIQPGQSQVVLAELGGTIDGATQLYVRVDDPNRIKEQDEGNNSFKVK